MTKASIDGRLWMIHKHRETGELLGPTVELSAPTRVVYAIKTPSGWVEMSFRPNPSSDRMAAGE